MEGGKYSDTEHINEMFFPPKYLILQDNIQLFSIIIKAFYSFVLALTAFG